MKGGRNDELSGVSLDTAQNRQMIEAEKNKVIMIGIRG